MEISTGDRTNQLVVAYDLILDNRRINAEARVTHGFTYTSPKPSSSPDPSGGSIGKTGGGKKRGVMRSGKKPRWHLGGNLVKNNPFSDLGMNYKLK